MKHPHVMFALALTLSLGINDIEAQTQPQSPAQAPSQTTGQKGQVIPLQVQIVISRYQGDKKIGSLPYTLAVNAYTVPPFPARPAQLKMASGVPIMSPPTTTEKPTSETAQGAATTSRNTDASGALRFNYQNIGTQIDCSAIPAGDGRFELNISIEDSSIYVDDQVVKGVSKGKDPPIFRSFRSRNDLILRDGQSIQFTAATDRISGEVIRIDVTLNVLK